MAGEKAKRHAFLAMVLACAAWIAPTIAGAGHNWLGGHPHPMRVTVYHDSNVGSCFKDRLGKAATGWLTWTSFDISYGGAQPIGPLSTREVVVGWGSPTNPAALGETAIILGHGSTLMSMVINPDVPWNYCSDDTPADKYDLWGTISHEFGHTVNLGDLLANDPACPAGVMVATMCPARLGTDAYRNPDRAEDIDSVAEALAFCAAEPTCSGITS